MKNHTFELDWPKVELPVRRQGEGERQEVKAHSQMSMYESSGGKTAGFVRAAGVTSSRW
jgi:hypothetical protein